MYTLVMTQDWAKAWNKRKNKIRRQKWDRQTILKYLGFGVLGTSLASVFLMMILFAWYAKDLPNPNRVVRRDGYSTKIVDRNGESIYDLYTDVNRVPVSMSEIPLQLQQATIAIEDKEFYTHQGFSMWGMVRGFSRLFTRGYAQGGSTLTQQLVKNVLLSSERSLPRKFKELVLSLQIERKFSKDEILQMYLNEAPYGGTAVGIAAASDRYFGKTPMELTLTEVAILAGMPQAPSRYSPYGSSPEAYIGRSEAVLRRMREDGYISEEQEKQSVSELSSTEFLSQSVSLRAPHFVFFVKDQLAELLGESAVEAGGFTVTTTLDLSMQEVAQEAVTEEIAELEGVHITNGAAIMMDPQSGEILAMVGSKDYSDPDYDGKVNVVMSMRQPGSAIKPVTYAAAFSEGYSPGTMILDVPTKFPGGADGEFYEPRNYDGEFRGPVQLRYALGSSLNVPAVKLLSLVGLKDMLSLAYSMGLDSLEPTTANMNRLGLSATLGGGEVRLFDLARAYSSFANGGERVESVSILKVERDGKTLYENKSLRKSRVMSEEVAFLINDVLSDNNARLLTFGSNSYLNMGARAVAVKTGTTNDKRDNWTIGWSSNVLIGVWVGNNDNSPMTAVASGVSGASPIWRKIMIDAWDKYKGDEFKPPSGVEQIAIDKISGYPEHDGYPSRNEYFAKGTIPSILDPIHTKVKVCSSDENRLAPEVDVARDNFHEKEYYVLKSLSLAWEDDIAGWIETQSDEKYKVPSEYCSADTEVVIGFEKPGNNSKVETSSGDVEIRLRATTGNEIEWLKLYVNGNEEESVNSSVMSTTIVLTDGVYELKGKVRTKGGKESETYLKIGVNTDPNATPSPSPSPSASPAPSVL